MNKKNISAAFLIALIVGTMLNAINSYDVFIEGDFSLKNTAKILLTYLTPFCVSLYSSVKAAKQMVTENNR